MLAIYFNAIDGDIGTRWCNYAEAHLKPCQTSMMKRSKAVDCFRQNAPSEMFDSTLSSASKNVKKASKGCCKLTYIFQI